MTILDGYLTPAEAADLLNVDVYTVRKWCRRKTIEARQVGRNYFIPTATVQAMLTIPRPKASKPFLNVNEAAQMLNIKPITLRHWIETGRVATVRRGRRLEIAQDVLLDLMNQLEERYQR